MKNSIIFPVFLSAVSVFCDLPFPGRGVNLGDWLEAPKNENWGVSIDSVDFVNIAQKGFNNIRIPARFSDYVTNEKRVSPEFMQKVKWAVDQTIRNKMTAIIDVHHFEGMAAEPQKYFEILKNIWEDVSQEFANYKDSSVLFELMNEPHDATTIELWNIYPDELVKIIRKTNKTRPILLGTADWGGFSMFKTLKIPEDDNLIVTLHYYNPGKFTHQGADWAEGSNAWLGTRWTQSGVQKLAMLQDFEEVYDYAKRKNLKIHIGEFGAYDKAIYDDRVLWTEYAAALCSRFGFAFSYWEYSSGFGLYDPQTKKWREELTAALFSTKEISSGDYSIGNENLVRNPNFENKAKNWTYGVWDKTGSADFEFSDGGLSINVSKIPSDVWGIQVIQEKLPLEAGKSYLLSFDAAGDSAMTLYACVETDEDYEIWGGITASVPAKNVKAVIQTEKTSRTINLIFNLGLSTGKAVLSNVSIKEIVIDAAPVSGQKLLTGLNRKIFISGNVVNAYPSAQFEVISANGKVIFSGKCGADGKAEIKNTPKGIYTVRIGNNLSLKYICK
ncbi:MAG: cellulase family glycosylhydrolase [Chitinispirillales bacterium]|jgi:endoglucanase|nr:cellulase family glycosylhydrolase [Chitinispirillales bacterium]